MAQPLDTKSSVKLGVFQFQPEATCVSSQTKEFDTTEQSVYGWLYI